MNIHEGKVKDYIRKLTVPMVINELFTGESFQDYS